MNDPYIYAWATHGQHGRLKDDLWTKIRSPWANFMNYKPMDDPVNHGQKLQNHGRPMDDPPGRAANSWAAHGRDPWASTIKSWVAIGEPWAPLGDPCAIHGPTQCYEL